MKRLNLNIDDELHLKLSSFVNNEKITKTDFIISAIEFKLEFPNLNLTKSKLNALADLEDELTNTKALLEAKIDEISDLKDKLAQRDREYIKSLEKSQETMRNLQEQSNLLIANLSQNMKSLTSESTDKKKAWWKFWE